MISRFFQALGAQGGVFLGSSLGLDVAVTRMDRKMMVRGLPAERGKSKAERTPDSVSHNLQIPIKKKAHPTLSKGLTPTEPDICMPKLCQIELYNMLQAANST